MSKNEERRGGEKGGTARAAGFICELGSSLSPPSCIDVPYRASRALRARLSLD